jgi:thiosulfate dehydrogenase
MMDALYVDEKVLLQNEMAKFWKATDINLVTDEVLGAIRVWKRFNFSAKYLGPNGSVKKNI